VALKSKGRSAIFYGVVVVVAVLVAMAPIYYGALSRFVFKPLWELSASVGHFSEKVGHAVYCFSTTSSTTIYPAKTKVYIGEGAYAYGFITGVRWIGDIREFYVRTSTHIPSKVDSVVVFSDDKALAGKVDSCDHNGCWVISIWDNHFKIPVFLSPSGYIGWLEYRDDKHVFVSISAPLEPVSPGEKVYWLGNSQVYVGMTTSTLAVNTAYVKTRATRMHYVPVFIYTEVLSNNDS